MSKSAPIPASHRSRLQHTDAAVWSDVWRWVLSGALTGAILWSLFAYGWTDTPVFRADSGNGGTLDDSAMELVRVTSRSTPATTPASANTPTVATGAAVATAAPLANAPTTAAAMTHPNAVVSTDPLPPEAPEAGPVTPMRPSEPKAAGTPAGPRQGGTLPVVAQEQLDPGFRLLAPVRPRYPAGAWQRRLPGRVRLAVEVDDLGQVAKITVLEETQGWGFGEAAQAAYATARFSPPRRQGAPVRVRWLKTLVFQP